MKVTMVLIGIDVLGSIPKGLVKDWRSWKSDDERGAIQITALLRLARIL